MIHTRNAYKYCREVVKRSAGNFFYAFQLLPRTKRYAIYAVYTFCRAADDAVDELPDISLRRAALDLVKSALERVYSGNPRGEMEIALADTIGKYRLTKQYFDDLLIGMEGDIKPVAMNNFSELEEYCYRAAGTVGLLCLEVFGVAGEKSKKYAIALGQALQLTNVIRDMRADALNGRIYIPKDLLAQYGVTVEEIAEGRTGRRPERLIRALISLAKSAYEEAERHRPRSAAARLMTSEAMRRVYRALLAKIEENPQQVLVRRVSLPPWRKAGEVLAAVTIR
ncbi:MAG: squalene/phytoene synthase family protein [Candidatus Electryonea clarkiae]|nr:squalene/phytoene synthase family protein [Candidatus Electryonea clarkiae]MDP8285501.1 squalene/phytoene synthase family protein [Candidatus Electryonea clarkiae]